MFSKESTEKDLFEKIREQSYQSEQLRKLLQNSLLGPEFSNCSCPECDSLRCFTIRRDLAESICTCSDCEQSNTCLLYVDDNNTDNRPILKTPRSDSNLKNTCITKNVDFCDKSSFEEIMKSKTEYVNTIMPQTGSSETRTKSYSRIQTSVSRYPCKNISKTTAQLSAQIMNVPINDYNQSLSTYEPSEEFATKIGNVKQDIFSRLKEIYEACSCKVCECIPVSSFFTRTDTCSCKPCDCNECKHLYRHISDIKETPNGGCPCIRCDRKECRGITKKRSKIISCDCKPCDCIKCSESFSKPCNCEPCQCLECRSIPTRLSRNVVVAPVQEHILRNLCDCSPCECSNCTHNYNTTSNMRERSTGTVTHSYCPCDNCTNDSCQSDGANCRCEMNKGIMNKPIQRAGHDYDIRSILTTNVWPTIAEYKQINKTNIIAMNAKVPQICLDGRVNECKCEDCNCVACDKINSGLKSTFSSTLNFPHNFNLSDLTVNGNEIKCECNICDCLNCGLIDCTRNAIGSNPIRQEFVANYVPNHCKCNSCECVNCMKDNLGSNIHDLPNRRNVNTKEKTPSISDIVIKKSQKPSKPFLKAMTKDMNMKFYRPTKTMKSKHNVSVYRALSHHNYYDPQSSMTILDCNLDDSSVYFSAQNSVDELLTPGNMNVCHSKYISNDAPLMIKEPLSNAKFNIVCEQDDDDTFSKTTISSSHFLTNNQAAQFFTDQNPCFRFTNNSNYIENATIQYSNPIRDIKINYQTNNSNCPVYFKQICNKDISAFDYNKVITTLQDAQKFSVKLNKILETYEMANNNFVSVSQRLRSLHETIFNNNANYQPNMENIKVSENNDDSIFAADTFVGDSKNTGINENSSSFKESLSTSVSSTEDETKLKPIFGSHNLLENKDYVELKKRIRKPERLDVLDDESKTSEKYSQSKTLTYSSINRFNKRRKLYQGFYKHSKAILKRLTQKQIVEKFTETISSLKTASLLNSSLSTDNNEKQQQNISLNTTITCIFKDADFYKDVSTNSDDNYFLKEDDKVCKKESLKVELIVQSKETNKEREVFSSDQSHILRKNLYLNTERTTRNKYICKIPLLEVNVKQVLGMISQEIHSEAKHEKLNALKHRHSRTMEEKIYSNIRRFLNGLVSRAILRSELKATRHTAIGHQQSKPSVKIARSCTKNETLKAGFYNLRRISDHTVLVKWTIPQDLSEVQGYEVDGRAVQKIFSPRRSIAVVTCLPHNEKVLLSIRTLTTIDSCNPITTIVYQPRIK